MKFFKRIDLIVIIFMFVSTMIAMFFMPAAIPLHWDNHVVETGSKYTIFAFPIISLGCWLLTPVFGDYMAESNKIGVRAAVKAAVVIDALLYVAILILAGVNGVMLAQGLN